MRLALFSLVAAAATSGGCLRQTEFRCTASAECSRGVCESTGYCSFTDSTCSTGRRYGDLSGMYSNQCVGAGGDAGTDGGGDAGLTVSIGGVVSGLSGTGLVLQNNGGDDLSISANGPFMFAAGVPANSNYQVTVLTPPSGQTVTLGNAQGVVGTAPITNVAVTCTTPGYTDPGIACGGGECTVANQKCCHDPSTAAGTCSDVATTCVAPAVDMTCDDSADCGGSPMLCCAHISPNGALKSAVMCGSTCTGSGNETAEILCDPNVVGGCPSGSSCVADATRGWYYCS